MGELTLMENKKLKERLTELQRQASAPREVSAEERRETEMMKIEVEQLKSAKEAEQREKEYLKKEIQRIKEMKATQEGKGQQSELLMDMEQERLSRKVRDLTGRLEVAERSAANAKKQVGDLQQQLR